MDENQGVSERTLNRLLSYLLHSFSHNLLRRSKRRSGISDNSDKLDCGNRRSNLYIVRKMISVKSNHALLAQVLACISLNHFLESY